MWTLCTNPTPCRTLSRHGALRRIKHEDWFKKLLLAGTPSEQCRTNARPAIAKAVAILLCFMAGFLSAFPANAQHQGAGSNDAEQELREDLKIGVLPSLSTAFRLPESIRLRYPDTPVPAEGPVDYNRVFPLGAEKVLERGYLLPSAVGVSLIGVRNVGVQDITDIDIALGIDVAPPPGTELRSIPFVNVKSVSDTTSPQVKADLWVLPFVNVYGVLGKVEGRADLTVNVDFDQVVPVCRPNPLPPPRPTPGNPRPPPRPPICVGEKLGGQRTLEFPTFVDATTLTLGATGVYATGNFFGSATVNGTLTVSGKDKSDVRS